MLVFVNSRLLKGGGCAVLYRNERPNKDHTDRYIVWVDSKGHTGEHPFSTCAEAKKWRQLVR